MLSGVGSAAAVGSATVSAMTTGLGRVFLGSAPSGQGMDFRRVLIPATWLLLVLYVLVLLFRRDTFDLLIDGVLGLGVQWVPVAVCWMAVVRSPARRAMSLIALAVTSYASGSTINVFEQFRGGPWVFPSVADVGFLLFYPLVLAGLVVWVLGHSGRLPEAALLDSAVGSLGAGAVLALVLVPLLTSEVGYSSPIVVALALAYPLCDFLTIVVAAGIAALPWYAMGGNGVMLLLGPTAFALTDVVYAYQVVDGSHQLGTLLEAGWAAGLCLVATWANGLDQRGSSSADASRPRLAVPTLASAAAVAVLVAGTSAPAPELAVFLAAATLVAAMFRTRWAFRQLVTLEEVHRRARTDDLTGLPNRRAVYEEVPARIDGNAKAGALLLLDLDRFKEINDSLGHDAGDIVLTGVAKRLAQCLSPSDLMARIGGDEFVVFLENTSREESESVAAHLQESLSEPFGLNGLSLQVNASIGISLLPDHGRDLKGLLRKAELAMYTAKAFRSGHHVHIRDDNRRGEARLRALQELRTALTDDQLTLHFQPKIELTTGQVSGVEALVRWNHPERGLLQPADFLPLAEEAGLMNKVTSRVLDLALDQTAAWHTQRRMLTVAVNLSASQLIDMDLPNRIGSMLQQRHLPGTALILEITEEVMMPDRNRAREILSRLRDKDIKVSIDDFGTGYSSLAYLRDLPANEIKIDKSFVMPMTTDTRAADLVVSIITLAQSAGLTIVAEGVEDRRHLHQLIQYGCDQAQGFYISKPLPLPALETWLTRNTQQQMPTEARFQM